MTDLNIAVGQQFPIDDLDISLDLPAVIYFYPKDKTEGCEIESRGFDRLYDDFKSAGYAIAGVSAGDDTSAREFAEQCEVRFPIIARRELCDRLGLLRDFGDKGTLPERVTLLVDRGGSVARVWHVEDVHRHASDVLQYAVASDPDTSSGS